MDAQAVRYLSVGAVVATVYFALPLALATLAGLPIGVAIVIGYVVAVSLHFVLQRRFVFPHGDRFALTVRQQMARYLVIGAAQLAVLFGGIRLLTWLTGWSDAVAYVVVTVVITAGMFLLLRGRVFHARRGPASGPPD